MTDKDINKLHYQVYGKQYKQTHRQAINENQRRRRKLNPEKTHEYYLNAKAKRLTNPDTIG